MTACQDHAEYCYEWEDTYVWRLMPQWRLSGKVQFKCVSSGGSHVALEHKVHFKRDTPRGIEMSLFRSEQPFTL